MSSKTINKMPLVLSYDNLVIGSSLEALYFAHNLKIHVIWTQNQCPLIYEKCEDYGLGDSPHFIWEQLSFQLSIGGYMPFDDRIKTIYYLDKETLKAVTKQESIIYIKFKHLYVFDDKEFFDIPVESGRTTDKQTIYDIFYTRRITGLYGDIYPENSLITTAYHYKEKRRNNFLTKCESHIAPEPYMVRLKLIDALNKDPLIKINKQMVVEHKQRILYDKSVGIREDFDNVTFIYNDIATMHAFSNKRSRIDYMKYFRMKLGIEWKSI
jgi:hypothetical protein